MHSISSDLYSRGIEKLTVLKSVEFIIIKTIKLLQITPTCAPKAQMKPKKKVIKTGANGVDC